MMVDANGSGTYAQVQGLNYRQGDGSVAKRWLLVVVGTGDAPVVEHMVLFGDVQAPFDWLLEHYPDADFQEVE